MFRHRWPNKSVVVWLKPRLISAGTLKRKKVLLETRADATRYLTIADECSHKIEVKKSKFPAVAWRVTSVEEAGHRIEQNKDLSASHNCFAYKIGDEFRCSDDGEPAGTAGKPILLAIESQSLDRVCVLVTRVFGGTKLGAGGLIRAYAQAARDCLRLTDKVYVEPRARLTIEVSFDKIGSVFQILEMHNAKRIHEDYTERGVILEFSILATRREELDSALLSEKCVLSKCSLERD